MAYNTSDFDRMRNAMEQFWTGDGWVGPNQGFAKAQKPSFVTGVPYLKQYNADDVIRGLDKAIEALNAQTYPHYDIVEYGPDVFSVDVAVAGFAKEELSVVMDKGTLTVKGEHVGEKPDVKYQHQGIAKRKFTLTLKLGEHVKVQGDEVAAELRDGILKVNLVREVPEEGKPQEITIW